MSKFIKLFGSFYNVGNQTTGEFVIGRFGISERNYHMVNYGFFQEIIIREIGGKGGFGRAVKEEGKKRSRHLPYSKDACRTLSGQRIGTLKRKSRIINLKAKIEALNQDQKLLKEAKKRSNEEKETSILRERDSIIKDTMKSAVAFAKEVSKPTHTDEGGPFNNDILSELDKEGL